jgi:uncharacterized damage-inducible protein DinB
VIKEDVEIRDQLARHLQGGEAFMTVDALLKEMKFEKLGERPNNLPYSFYELFYHIWFTQRDILIYCTAEIYEEFQWPKDYWPEKSAPDTEAEWYELRQAYFDNRKELSDFLMDPKNNLMKPVRLGTKHSLLREILIVIEHSAYHNGQLLIILRHLGLHSV